MKDFSSEENVQEVAEAREPDIPEVSTGDIPNVNDMDGDGSDGDIPSESEEPDVSGDIPADGSEEAEIDLSEEANEDTVEKEVIPAQDVSDQRASAFGNEEIALSFAEDSSRQWTPEATTEEFTEAYRKGPNERVNVSAKNSDILGKNLKRAGEIRPGPNFDAAHIVPDKKSDKDGYADRARDALERAGIDINSAENGVWLESPNFSRQSPLSITETFTKHDETHKPEYFKLIGERLQSVSPEQVRDELLNIKSELKEGRIVLSPEDPKRM